MIPNSLVHLQGRGPEVGLYYTLNQHLSLTFRSAHASLSHLVDGELGEQSLRLFVGHGRVNDHVVALLPVDRSRDAVLVSDLEG